MADLPDHSGSPAEHYRYAEQAIARTHEVARKYRLPFGDPAVANGYALAQVYATLASVPSEVAAEVAAARAQRRADLADAAAVADELDGSSP